MARVRPALPVGVAIACLLVLGAPTAGAEPPTYGAAGTLCTVRDPALTELSGLVASGDSLYAVADGGDSLRIVALDRACTVIDEITAAVDPFDVEDLAVAADGAFWLADTGDNRFVRDTVALHRVAPDGSAQLFRLVYPDGRHDAEALLLDRSGRPFVVTKDPLGASGVYTPSGPLDDLATPLERVTALRFAPTGTPGGPGGVFGQVAVTGGAVSADGTLVALRTYTDVYLYAAPDADVAAALSRPAIRIALPPQPQGEAVAVDVDGVSLLVAGEGLPGDVLRLPGAAAAPTSGPSTATSASLASPSPSTSGSPSGRLWWGLLGVPIVGLVGVVLAGSRRRTRSAVDGQPGAARRTP